MNNWAAVQPAFFWESHEGRLATAHKTGKQMELFFQGGPKLCSVPQDRLKIKSTGNLAYKTEGRTERFRLILPVNPLRSILRICLS